MEKRDLLRECNDQQVPLEDFARQFCDRCLQAECSRSQHGKSRFEQRITGWQDKLFAKPPRMDLRDPRYDLIQGKKFLEIPAGPIPEIGRGAWTDPRDLGESTDVPPEAPMPSPTPPKLPNLPPAESLVEEDGPPTDPAPAPISEAKTPTTPPATMPRNTSFRQGQMLAGAKAPASKPNPVYDPWAAPNPSQNDGSRVVKPGARIKLGS